MARLMVLGLLKLKPMSGYEIQQILLKSHSDEWAGILPGSIYHALKKMEKEKLVEIDSIEQTGNRSKAIYKITEQGEVAFHDLLIESFQVSSVHLPSNLYTGLSFIEHLEKEQIVHSLKIQLVLLEQQLHQQKLGIKEKRKYMPLDPVTEMLFENVFQQYELQLQLIKNLIAHYEGL
ncbi:PadR family transcriptional regulator [Solibacillus sp. CAU 1738]|uniref:PadR family transcriptional regulator n=1 Tax=Solibacillus sp. CAU 1738 TaxID=3140363 RepID=UPI0032605E71